MAETVSLELIGKTVLETRDTVRRLAGLPEAIRQLQGAGPVCVNVLNVGSPSGTQTGAFQLWLRHPARSP